MIDKTSLRNAMMKSEKYQSVYKDFLSSADSSHKHLLLGAEHSLDKVYTFVSKCFGIFWNNNCCSC